MSEIPTTLRNPFGRFDESDTRLFEVCQGVPATAALEQASLLLEACNTVTEELAMGELPNASRLHWACLHLTAVSKALVDASLAGMVRRV